MVYDVNYYDIYEQDLFICALSPTAYPHATPDELPHVVLLREGTGTKTTVLQQRLTRLAAQS